MAERSKALRSGRSPLLWAWVQIPLLTFCLFLGVSECGRQALTVQFGKVSFFSPWVDMGRVGGERPPIVG